MDDKTESLFLAIGCGGAVSSIYSPGFGTYVDDKTLSLCFWLLAVEVPLSSIYSPGFGTCGMVGL